VSALLRACALLRGIEREPSGRCWTETAAGPGLKLRLFKPLCAVTIAERKSKVAIARFLMGRFVFMGKGF
jgi:hypothetical protein